MDQKTKERIADDIVVLVVYPPWGVHVAQSDPRASHVHLKAATLVVLPHPAVSLAHGAGNPGELHVSHERGEGCYKAACATAWLKLTFGGKAVFHGTAIANHNEAPTLQHFGAQFQQLAMPIFFMSGCVHTWPPCVGDTPATGHRWSHNQSTSLLWYPRRCYSL